MRLTVTSDREEDGRYIGEVAELSGCLVYGATRAEADARARALALHILADEIDRGDRSARSITDLSFDEATVEKAPCRRSHVPNAETRAAMREARRGGLRSARDIPSLLAELNADD